MGVPGYDVVSGNGFVQANRVLSGFANPVPQLNGISVNQQVVAGEEYTNIILTADGDYFTPESKIIVRDDTIQATFISSSEISATIILNGDPGISVYTPPRNGTNGSDGGSSVVRKIFDVEKMVVTIKSDNQTKYYLEELPEYTYTATGLPEGITLESLGLTIVYDAPATTISNVGDWQIIPYFETAPEAALTELYDFQFPAIEDQGRLTILQLGIKITPEDITGLYYGDSIPAIQSRIEVTTPGVVIDQALLDDVLLEYESLFSPDVDYAVANASRSLANASRSLANASRSLANGTSWLISGTAVINQSRSLANAARSLANASRSLANGNTVVDIDTQIIEAYEETPGGTELILNAARSLANASRSLANAQILATGDFNLLTNASRSLANTSGLINAELFNEESNSEVVFIFDKDNTDLDGGANLPVTNIYPIHLVTGLDVTSDEDYNHCWVLPGAYISNGNSEGYLNTSNFDIDYGQGMIEILPAPLTVIANDSTKVYGADDPAEFAFTISEDTPLVLDDIVDSVFTGSLVRAPGEDASIEGSSYAISQGTLSAGPNYDLTVITGEFAIIPASLSVTVLAGQTKVYGQDDPILQYSSSGLVGGDTFTGALSREEGEDVGEYAVTIGDLSAGSNYTTTLSGGGIFTITRASLTVTVIPGQSKVYSEDDPILEYTSIGLVGGRFRSQEHYQEAR
ncbi:MAG: MBG domain-containing protein [Cyclobacteriaceae bacterium]|nr:MBG domain-containing protein [Cyclobacteriaceae bacterium]